MLKYILKRLLFTIPVIFCVSVLVFTLMYLTPGDPAINITGPGATQAELEGVREYYGLNDPYIVRLGDFLHKMFIEFDLGESWMYKTSITSEIMTRLPRTVFICMFSVLAAMFIGIPMGVVAAVHQDGIADKIVLMLSSVMRCVPNFWVALMLVILFALRLDILPAYGIQDGILSYVLPCFTIMIVSFPNVSRQMRSSMLEVIRTDYVTAARAQGFSKNSVHYVHALPNALIPIITMLGSQFAVGLGGTMILETIFSIPGMGMFIQSGIKQRDQPVVTGSVTILAITFCLIMLLVDLCYALVDPRIRAQYEGGKKSVRGNGGEKK